MNLQRRSMPVRRTGNHQKDQKSWTFKFYLLVYLLMVATVFFGALNYRVDLNRKSTELQRARATASRQIKEMELDIQSLKVTRERLSSWENISKRIAEYKLPLRPAEPHQIRYISGNQLYTQRQYHTAQRQTSNRDYYRERY